MPVRILGSRLIVPGLLTACLLQLAACQSRAPDEGLYQGRIAIFGTLVEITLRDVDQVLAEQAIGDITRDFQRMHNQWHAWNPGPLVDLNAALASGESLSVPDLMIGLIERATDLSLASRELFNPAIGGLLGLWGFQSSSLPEGPPPDDEAIRAWVERAPSMADIEIDGQRVSSGNPAVQLDFGAIGKGYAIDHAIAHLQALGIGHAIINGGGDVRVLGTAHGRAWRIGIRHPGGEHDEILASLELADGEAVFTSGNYERFRRDRQLRHAHILDPRTGWPVEGVTSVTVVHADGTVADAAATALVIADDHEWPEIAAAMGVDQVLRVTDDGTVWMTPAMAERVEFQRPPERVRVVELPPIVSD